MSAQNHFPKNLADLMAAQGLTDDAVAVRLQAKGYTVTGNTVRCWRNGSRQNPNFRNAQALAAVLGVTMDDLLAPPKAKAKKGGKT
jgi:transcriptional regulator with XRE-family HTH domain